MLLGTQKINSKGHLEIGGCDTIDLANEYGTPLYVMDEALIRDNASKYVKSIKRAYGDAEVAYASKAFIVLAMCKLAKQEGLWLDVASAGELYTAKKVDFPMDNVLFHGNYKSEFELEMAVDENVACVVCDSFSEIEKLNCIAKSKGKIQNVMIRCNPGVDPHTHSMISTGQEDSKFGFNIKSGKAMEAIKSIVSCENLKLIGLHSHLGSQLLLVTPFEEAAPLMANFFKTVTKETGVELEILDLGGGLGVRYLEEHNPMPIEDFTKLVSDAVKNAFNAENLKMPKLILEPGRSIVGEAGTTLYRVGTPKEVNIVEEPYQKYYLPVDGGLSDNPRPALYESEYSLMIANKVNKEKTHKYTVSGKHCETDKLFPDVMLQEAECDDILAVQTTGAYNHAMASNYNRFTRPAVVFVKDGVSKVVYRRETLEDLLNCDIIPENL